MFMEDNGVQKKDDSIASEPVASNDNTIVIKKSNLKRFSKGLTVFLLIIIVVAALGFLGNKLIPKKESNVYDFNGYSFQEVPPLVYTEVQIGKDTYTIPLHFGPRDLKNVSFDGSLTTFNGLFAKNGFTFLLLDSWDEPDGNLTLAVNELSKYIGQVLKLKTVAACTFNNSESCSKLNMTIMNCSDSKLPVVYFKNEGTAGIAVNGSCITLYGASGSIIESENLLLLHWFGIMK